MQKRQNEWMKVLVMGAGVVGVSTAYALGRLGHQVMVIEKASEVASGASHANGAQLSYSYVDPFASPDILSALPKYIVGLDSAIKLGFSAKRSYYQWGIQFLKNCKRSNWRSNLETMLKLAKQSQKAFSSLQNETATGKLLASSQGKIVLATSHDELAKFRAVAEIKQEYGFPVKILERADIIRIEPALQYWTKNFIGGAYAAQDLSLDPRIYCEVLKEASENNYSVKYSFNQNIIDLNVENKQVVSVQTETDTFECDVAINCLGNNANDILKKINATHSIYPQRGYSVTLPTGEIALKTSVTDPASKVVFTNIGNEIRIAGFLDVNQTNKKIDQRVLELFSRAKELWPAVADFTEIKKPWSGERPATPSGVPIIGASQLKGLYNNIGHGYLGYTLAAGSAEQIASLFTKQKESLSMSLETEETVKTYA